MNFFGLFRRSAEPRPQAPAAVPLSALPERAGAPGESSPPPDHVRRLLFDAVAAGDERRLESLCHEHQDVILRSGPAWLEVPEAFRASPEAYEWYGNGLRALARYCADKVRDGDVEGSSSTVLALDRSSNAAPRAH